MDKPKRKKPGRFAVCVLLILLVFAGFELRLMQWQIIDGDKYEQQSLSSLTDSIEIDAARGELWDRNGKVLAGNRTSYDVIYNALYMDFTPGARNATILEVVDLLEENGEDWVDNLPIELSEEGEYLFKEEDGSEREISRLKGKDMLNLADYATADDCMRELARLYGCQGFSKRDTLTITSVRYGMTKGAYSRNNPYTIAKDISPDTVGILSEAAHKWPGIEVRVSVARYNGGDGTLAPHVLGYSGKIPDTTLQKVQEDGRGYNSKTNLSGYKMNDIIGISGAEAAFEEQLRGQRGQQSIFTDENGDVVSTAMTVQPQEGHTVQLTLDSELQRVANLSLEKNIKGNTEARHCTAGAVVALDVKNFDVLVCSSYPTYDLNRSLEDAKYYQELVEDEENKPLVDRALGGTFVPGSVFKPMVAIAGLQEGVFNSGTALYPCNGKFEYYDMTMGCTDIHGYTNVYGAISGSCNAFFAQAGLDIGIARLDAYAEYFGLGQYTGVELSERKGVMSNPQEYMEKWNGAAWTGGITAQTAIGQADNLFTPIQLATYCATIANMGVRKQAHFLDKVLDYTGEEVLEDFESPVIADAGISQDVMSVVWEAMRRVCTEGTARSIFSDYPVTLAAKTGTAENSNDPEGRQANLSFICFAPMEDPEIAVAVMIEEGHKGSYAQNVAKDVLDQYFGFYTWDEDGNRRNPEGKRVDEEGNVIEGQDDEKEEEGEKGKDPASSEPEEGEPTASPSPKPSRGSDIPDAPYAGESPGSAPEGSAAPSPTPRPNNGPEGAPYYKGSGTKKSGEKGESSAPSEPEGEET